MNVQVMNGSDRTGQIFSAVPRLHRQKAAWQSQKSLPHHTVRYP